MNRSRSKPNTTTATGRRSVPFLALARVQGLGHFASVQPRRTDGQLLLSLKRRDVRHRGGRTSHLSTDDGRPNILFFSTHSSAIDRSYAAPQSGVYLTLIRFVQKENLFTFLARTHVNGWEGQCAK